MEIKALREEIDVIDRQLVALLERRMDTAAGIAACKRERGLPVLDEGREAEKLAAVRAQCRPETADGIAGVFETVMAESRAYQTALLEARHDG